jgi:CubicO group peptidase (beta-lactamase class C family)
MLLSHSSGLPGYARLFESCPDAEALFAACLRLPLEAAPGSRTEYSDPGFILLGRILEEIASQSLSSFANQEIFLPWAMTSTRFVPPDSWKPHAAPTEDDRSFRHRVIQGEAQDENCYVLGGISGHAGLFSNVLDPLLFARHLLAQVSAAPSSTGMSGPLDASTIEHFIARSESPSGSSRALGWDTPSFPSSSGSFFSTRSAGHLGYSGTSIWIDFEYQLGVVLLTNRTWPKRQSDLIREIRPAFHDAIVKVTRVPS